MPTLSLKEGIELALLLVLTGGRIWRWVFKRESDDQTLGARVEKLEDAQDEKADCAELDRLEKALEKAERDMKDLITAQGNRFHAKLGEVNVAAGRQVSELQSEIRDLRRRIDAHIDHQG